jgi:hypothetical protein
MSTNETATTHAVSFQADPSRGNISAGQYTWQVTVTLVNNSTITATSNTYELDA